MKISDIKNDLKNRLSKARYVHSLGVASSAEELANRFGASAEKAYLAGLIHDSGKELSLDEMHVIVKEHHLQLDQEMLQSKALLHGPIGSIMAETLYDIDDEEIQSAIYFHTTGKAGMSKLDKIIFLADYIEPSRDFPGVEIIRKAAKEDLDQAMLVAYDSTIRHLLDQKLYIYPLTFEGRNDLVKSLKKR